MALETINTIREAETQAEQKILQAQDKSVQIVAEAEKHAAQLVADCKKKCAESVKIAESEDEAAALQKLESAVNEANAEAEALKESVYKRFAQAEAFLLDEMFSVKINN